MRTTLGVGRTADLGNPLLAIALLAACGEATPPASESAGDALPPLTQFTSDPGTERDAAWSPDGARISFNSQPAGGALWVMPAGGGPAEPLGFSSVAGAAWSPDGSRLAFIGAALAEGSMGRDVSIVARAGGTPRAITTGGPVEPGFFTGLDWSPAGDEIVFTRGGRARDLWGVAAEGGEPWQLTLGPGTEAFARYSPDGQRLAYAASSAAGALDWDIWLMPAEGGNADRLLDWPTIEWVPAWSPDGQRLALASNRGPDGEPVAPWQVWTVSATGRDPQWLAEGCHPEWSRDGRSILFIRSAGGMDGGPIWRVEADGGSPVPVLEGGLPKISPRLSPDGAQILFAEQGGAVADIWIADVSDLMRGR